MIDQSGFSRQKDSSVRYLLHDMGVSDQKKFIHFGIYPRCVFSHRDSEWDRFLPGSLFEVILVILLELANKLRGVTAPDFPWGDTFNYYCACTDN